MILRTDRLLLRRATAADLLPLHAIMSDPQTMRYWSSLPHPDLATTRDWPAGMIAAPPDQSDDCIVERAGVVIGKLGAWRLPEIGFLFARESWSHGYATEALSAYIAYAFAGRADHLTADVDPRNGASLRLLARCGFRETHRAARTWLVGDEYCDSIYLRLDRKG